jgi:predicted small secreted protein
MLKICAVAGLVALTGCNTVDGIGRDLSGSAMNVRGWFGR